MGDQDGSCWEKCQIGMTHLLEMHGSFFSKGGNKIEASCHYEEMQVLSVVMNRQSLHMKFGFLEGVRPGHIFLLAIPVCHNTANLSK